MPKSVLLGRLTSLYYWIALLFPPPDSSEIKLRVLRRFLWKDRGEQVKNSPDFLWVHRSQVRCHGLLDTCC